MIKEHKFKVGDWIIRKKDPTRKMPIGTIIRVQAISDSTRNIRGNGDWDTGSCNWNVDNFESCREENVIRLLNKIDNG